MTLSTDIYILDRVDPKQVFFQCQALLSQYDEQGRKPESQKWEEYQDGTWKRDLDITADDLVTPGREFTNREGGRRVWVAFPDGYWSRNNSVGQGLPAWLLTKYRIDAPLQPEEQVLEHDKWCCLDGEPDEICDLESHREQACWMKVDFDTAYGYRHPQTGWNCGDLHAALVTQLGLWLNKQELRWCWRNEYTGDIYQGHDGIDTLSEGAVDACAWFETMVKPAITVLAAEQGAGKIEW